MGPLDDFDELVKIIFFVVLFGGWILRAVFRSLIKKAAMRPPAQPGGAPAKGLREFLEEIRQEGAGGGAPARQVARVDEPDEELVWEEVDDEEVVDEAPRPAAQQGERTLFDERREQWKQETERRRAARERQRLEQVRRRQEELRGEPAPEEEVRERISLAERHLDSRLDERRIGSDLNERQLLSQLATRRIGLLSSAAARPSRAAVDRSPELVGALRGLTVKELILAEVILGKPRSKRRHFRDV